MTKLVRIHIQDTDIYKDYPLGTTLLEIEQDLKLNMSYPVLGAMVNNQLRELSYAIYKPKTIKFVDYTHSGGKRIYTRSLSMLLYKACHDLYPNFRLKIEHAVSKGLYCELEGGQMDIETQFQMVVDILDRMREIVELDLPFTREEMETHEALKVFEKFGHIDKIKLLRTRQQMYTSVYHLDDMVDYYYGHLVPSTGYLKNFDLVKYYDGMLLIPPQSETRINWRTLWYKINCSMYFGNTKIGWKSWAYPM